MSRAYAILIAFAVAAVLVVSATFTVQETERALMTALGEIKRSDYQPGLHFKVPFYNNVHTFDARVLTLDTRPQRALTSEKKNVVVDSFVKWRILDVEAYFTRTGGDDRNARALLSQFLNKGVLDAFGRRTVQEVISGERAALMLEIRNQAAGPVEELGIEVVDVRVKKVEFPSDVNDSVYRRMEKERATVAKTFRSEGDELAKGIRADADRQREEILADAYSDAQRIRGEGDAVAAGLYASAYSQDAEFYNLYRRLTAYRSAFRSRDDVLILKPDSEFFRYFNDPTGNE